MERRSYRLSGNGGIALQVYEWGPERARPVVMLHGIRSYAETFAALAESLNPRYRTIAYDQRGRGSSDWDPDLRYDNDAYVEDLKAVVRQLGLETFDLLGHSMGGIASIVYTSENRDRVRRLVIEDAGPGAFESSVGAARIRQELSVTPSSFPDWDAALEFMCRLRPSLAPSVHEKRLRQMLRKTANGNWRWRYDHAGIAQVRLNPDPCRVVDLWPHVKAIACPTLLLRGARSDYLERSTADAMSHENPNVEVRDVPGAGHSIHDDQPAVVAAWINAFFDRVIC